MKPWFGNCDDVGLVAFVSCFFNAGLELRDLVIDAAGVERPDSWEALFLFPRANPCSGPVLVSCPLLPFLHFVFVCILVGRPRPVWSSDMFTTSTFLLLLT
eukprot:Lithocolla_globosa_v1_NODE_136_length_5835_cov_11.826644.p13 type:complete len:101 gc:universal NODE_136_length_5835_cov_11.826644:5067-5369(+)